MNQVATANPFGSAKPQAVSNAVAQSASEQLIAEAQGRMVIAKRFPRDPIKACDAILQACTRPGLAEGALYSYSRGGTEITGPSIRLAEAMAQAWGNIDFGIRELSQSSGESTVEAFAWDMETNTRQSKVFQVPHKRFTRKGSYELTDPRDIYETVANNGARRLRACILGVIPGDVQEAAVNQCEVTLKANVDVTPEGVKKMQELFGDIGVTKEMIETRIQCRIESIRPAQIVQLRKIYQSIKDGMSAPADWFGVTDSPAPSAGDVALISDEQKKQIVDTLKELNVPEEKLCKKVNVSSIDMIPAERFKSVMGFLSAQRKAQPAKQQEQPTPQEQTETPEHHPDSGSSENPRPAAEEPPPPTDEDFFGPDDDGYQEQ